MSSAGHLSELESLRSQVAELSRKLAERDQSMQDLREQSDLLRTITEGTAAETGDEFFASLVTQLTSSLNVQYAVIGEVLDGPLKKIHTLAVSAGGILVDNFEYELAHTPCATALTQTFACFDRDVQATFPQVQRLVDLGAESYCAVPFRTKGGAVIGLLIVMDTKPLQYGGYLQSLLEIFAPRVAVEFERRRAEQERAQALADLHNVMETVPDIMFTLDNKGSMVKWNRRVEEVTGYSSEELLNKSALAFVPPEEQTCTAAAIQRAFTEGYAELEGHLLTKEHRLIPYHWTGALLKNPHGEPIGITGIGRDVSDKKRTEEELRQQRRHLVDAQALAHLGSWDWDVDTGEVEWSDEQFRIFGCEPGAVAVTYDTFLALLHPDDHAPVLAAINDALAGKTPYDIEYRIVRPNGDVRVVHARGEVHRDAAGHPLSMAGTVLDITDRKRAWAAIREAELRYRTIFEQAGAGVAQIESRTGRFVQVNHQYCEILGLTEAEMLAATVGAVTHPDDVERDLESMTRLLSGEIPSFTMEKRYVRKDGSIVWVNLNVAPLWRSGETPVHHIAIVQDITERKRAEDALRHSERQLRTVLDALPVGVWFTDQSGKPVLSNPAAKEIWSGIKQIRLETAADTHGWWEAIGPSSELHRWALSHALTKRIPSLNDTLQLECLDGTKKIIRNTTVPVQDEAGDLLGAIVLNEDVTLLRQAQEALKLTQFSVDHAVEGFFWIGPDARILNVNDAACRMLEYTRDELQTMTVHDIDLSLSPELWSAHWEKLKQKGSLTVESKYWSRTGRVLDTEVTVNYLYYEGSEYNCAIMRDIGERKRAEVLLRQSEERYRSLVDNAPIGIFVSEAGRFVYANRQMQGILNATSADQLLGTPVLDRIALEFHQIVKDRMRQLMDNGHPVPLLDEQFVKLDGSRVDVAVTAIPTSFEGVPVVQVLVLDITERKRTEEALREKHALLSAIMDTTMDIIFVKDLKGRYLHMNLAGARAVGIPAEEVVGKDDDAIWPADLAACCKVADQRVLASGATQTMEECTTAGGTRVTYLTTKAPYRDATGCLIGIIGVAHDITQIKRSEEQLRQSHDFIRQIIDADPNFIFVKDCGGRFTLANKAVAEAYGTTVDCLIGKTDTDFNANLDEVEFFSLKDSEVMGLLQERFIPEEAITDSTGRTRWLQTVKRPILDETGRAIMVFGASTDITERKRIEETLRQRERDLRAAVEERQRISQDLHDGILQSLFAVGLGLEASKSTMSPRIRKTSGPPLDQAIDQLNRVMHEIRNFIAGLGSDLLQGKDLPAALKQMLASLTQNQAMRVRLAVEDRAAQAVSAEQSLNLFHVIQEAVSNCIRHGRAQEARVSLKMLKQGVRLSIHDDGRGFNPETAKGSGHGLSNMAARAQKIGGRFTILSKVNEGTRIVLDLPKEATDVRR